MYWKWLLPYHNKLMLYNSKLLKNKGLHFISTKIIIEPIAIGNFFSYYSDK